MSTRIAQTLMLCLLTLVAFVPTTGATTSDCLSAKNNLLAQWNAAGREFTPEVARAIKEQFDSCPTVGTTSTSATCAAGTACAEATVRIPVGRECGFTGLATATNPDASITAWYQAGDVNQPEPDHGPAAATYLPTTDETTYHVTGEKWGFDASSTGTGTIYLYGVPIPARGDASAGCSAIGKPELCWARANAQVIIENIGGIVVTSWFTNC